MKRDYADYLLRREQICADSPMGDVLWLHQMQRHVKPFQIYGNLYYVGDSWVCVHIVDTGDGLLMFDAGNCGSGKALLLHTIWEMGFDPTDIRWCVLSHAHLDHIGCAGLLKEMFGTKLYISAADAQVMRETPERVLLQMSSDVSDELFEPDYEIKDGESLHFGGTKVRFCTVPGHTPGTLACFFRVNGPQGEKRVGYFGGYGFNTMTKEYLQEIGDTEYRTRAVFLNSIEKVIHEPVDIFMANHTDNGGYLEKMAAIRQNPAISPFIDPTMWQQYLNEKKQAMIAFMNDPVNQ